MAKKHTGGKPAHVPTKANRQLVKMMMANGAIIGNVAAILDITEPTLRKYYAHEITYGFDDANAKVACALYENATVKKNVTAQIFWLKSRAGWKETNVTEHTGADGGEIRVRTLNDFYGGAAGDIKPGS